MIEVTLRYFFVLYDAIKTLVLDICKLIKDLLDIYRLLS